MAGNMFDPSNNPFSQSANSDSDAGAAQPTDPQMQTADAAPVTGGDTLPVQAPTAQTSGGSATSTLHVVGCLQCGQSGTMRRIVATTRCRCGSDNLVYDTITVQAEFPPKKDDDKKEKKDDDSGDSSSSDSDPAGSVPGAPGVAPAPAADPNGATTGGDPSALEGEDEPGPVTTMIDPMTGQPVPVQAPPSEGTGPLPGEAADPNAAPDPNAAAQPGAPGVPASTDPMDIAQSTLDSVVDQANQLGHDAMETAYDVDSLFSEWRCQNCGAEGRGDISEDGQVAFSGDLLDQPQGCAFPQGNPNDPAAAAQPPGAPADPNAAPPAPDAAAAPPGADPAAAAPPADPAAAPPADPNAPPAPPAAPVPQVAPPAPGVPAPAAAPVSPAAPAAPGTPPPPDKDKEKKPAETKKGSLLNRILRRAVVDSDSAGLNDNRNYLDDNNDDPDADDETVKMARNILKTNPGMDIVAALEIAEDTFTRFPSLRESATTGLTCDKCGGQYSEKTARGHGNLFGHRDFTDKDGKPVHVAGPQEARN